MEIIAQPQQFVLGVILTSTWALFALAQRIGNWQNKTAGALIGIAGAACAVLWVYLICLWMLKIDGLAYWQHAIGFAIVAVVSWRVWRTGYRVKIYRAMAGRKVDSEVSLPNFSRDQAMALLPHLERATLRVKEAESRSTSTVPRVVVEVEEYHGEVGDSALFVRAKIRMKYNRTDGHSTVVQKFWLKEHVALPEPLSALPYSPETATDNFQVKLKKPLEYGKPIGGLLIFGLGAGDGLDLCGREFRIVIEDGMGDKHESAAFKIMKRNIRIGSEPINQDAD